MMNIIADRLLQTNALGEVHGVVLVNADVSAELDPALALGAVHVSVLAHDPAEATLARERLDQAVGTQGQAWQVADYGTEELGQTLPPRSADQRWVLRLGALLDIGPVVDALATYLSAAETGSGQDVAQPFTDIIADVPDGGDTAFLAPLGYVTLAICDGPAGGQVAHLIAAPRTRTAIYKLRQERDALQAQLDQATLNRLDLDDMRARYSKLLAEYGAQTDVLCEVQARVKAALDRMGLVKNDR